MKVAYATIYDSSDARLWSGLGYHVWRCLEMAGMTVERIGPLKREALALARLRQLEAKLQGRQYGLDRDPQVARAFAAQVEQRLDSTACDLVFSPGTIPIAYLETPNPVAFWTGATFGAMVRSYPEYRLLSPRALRVGADLEAHALARASVAFYTSAWAARSAVEDHGADPDRIEVVPWGANMRITHGPDAVVAAVQRRQTDRCRLLFVGVDWARKGGDKAVEAGRLLNERGLRTELDVVGAIPDRSDELPSWVRVHGYVDKTTDAGEALMRRLFDDSHFLIHPASAEAFGVVFCEAAAHGVVAVASNVGGIPSAVRDGVSGILCDAEAPSETYANEIWRLMEDRGRYEEMALGAFGEYTRNLSWEAQAVRVKARLARVA